VWSDTPDFSCKVMWLNAVHKETVPGCYFAAGLLLSSRAVEEQDTPVVFSHMVVQRGKRLPLN